MRVRWSLVLPASGLILFAALSCHSLRVNREVFKSRPSRYFWWSSIRLDSDPLSKHPMVPPTTCQDENKDCSTWDPVYIWVDPGWAEKTLVVSAFPAFVVSAAIVGGLAGLGMSAVSTFPVSVPVLIFAWFYFVGWLVDRWRYKRAR
jgi:hypothetical protein